MIVKHRERQATSSTVEFDIALEIHLPQIVGMLVFKALPSQGLGAALRGDQALPMQDARHGARRRGLSATQIAQAPGKLGRPPGGMRLTQFDHACLYFGSGTRGAMHGPSALIGQSGVALLEAPDPLVPRLRADAVLATQGAPIGPFSGGEFHEFKSQFHDVFAIPGHDLLRTNHSSEVLPMSWNRCYPCLRSIHCCKESNQRNSYPQPKHFTPAAAQAIGLMARL